MVSQKITKRYAKALLDLAIEKNSLDPIYQDVLQIAEVAKHSRQLVVILKNPIVLQNKKLKIMRSVFNDKLHPITFRFVELIVTKNRAKLLFEIFETFVDLYNEHKKIAKAKLYTAVKASDETINKVTKLIEDASQYKILLETIVDEKLIGGFKIRFEDTLIDGSVSSRLKQLEQELTE